MDLSINMKKFGVVLHGKIDHIFQLAYLNRQGLTRLLSSDEDLTCWIKKMD